MARRASVLACRPGSRSRTRVTFSDWLAPTHMNAAMTPSQTTSKIWTWLPADTISATGTTSTATARIRPAQAATMVAVTGLPVTFHTPARSIRPPSSGRPGSRLNTPTSRLAQTSCSISRPGRPPRWLTSRTTQPSAASTSESSGPAADTRSSRPGVGGSCSISENPPSG